LAQVIWLKDLAQGSQVLPFRTPFPYVLASDGYEAQANSEYRDYAILHALR